jgi:uncharacterized protein (TIGR03437 family)
VWHYASHHGTNVHIRDSSRWRHELRSISPNPLEEQRGNSAFGSGQVVLYRASENRHSYETAVAGRLLWQQITCLTTSTQVRIGNYAVATTVNYGLAVRNGTFSGATTTPAAPGEVIVLWGTGFGPTNPVAPEGVATPSTTAYNTAGPVTVTVGGVPATVYGAALAAGDAGLYQVAIQIPTSLASGDYPVVAKISSAQSPSTTLITVQN